MGCLGTGLRVRVLDLRSRWVWGVGEGGGLWAGWWNVKGGDEVSSSSAVDVVLSLLCFFVSLTSLKVQKKIPDHISTSSWLLRGKLGVGPTCLV